MRKFEDRNKKPSRFGRDSRRDSDDEYEDRPRKFEKRRDLRSRERGEMHKVVCDKCGKSCEVPFRPTPGKPVYCDECFGKKDNNSNNQLEEINRKLDKILKLLE